MDAKTKFYLGLKLRVAMIGAFVVILWFVFDHTFGLLVGAGHHDYLLMFFAAMAGSWATLLTSQTALWKPASFNL